MDFPVAQIWGAGVTSSATPKDGVFVPEHEVLVEINNKAGEELQWDRRLLRAFLKRAKEGKIVKTIQISHDVFTSLQTILSDPVSVPFNFYGVTVYVSPSLPSGTVIYS